MHCADPDTRFRRAQTQQINQAVDEVLQSANGEALLARFALAADEAAIPKPETIDRDKPAAALAQ